MRLAILPTVLLAACVGGDMDNGGKDDTGPDTTTTTTTTSTTEDSDTGPKPGDTDTTTTTDERDADGDGFPAGPDCDDGDPRINPEADERCNGVDDDCDGEADDDAVDARTWYADSDGDGFGDDAMTTLACDQPAGTSTVGGDCDDRDERVSPDSDEDCENRVDDNCDGDADDADRSCTGGGETGIYGVAVPFYLGAISSPGGSFDSGIFEYAFFGFSQGEWACELYGELVEGRPASTSCSGCDYEFNFEPMEDTLAVGDYCGDLGLEDSAFDGLEIGLGWNDDGYWYLYYDGSWGFFGAHYPDYLFYSYTYGEDGGQFITPVYGVDYADYVVYYYR